MLQFFKIPQSKTASTKDKVGSIKKKIDDLKDDIVNEFPRANEATSGLFTKLDLLGNGRKRTIGLTRMNTTNEETSLLPRITRTDTSIKLN